MLTQSFFLLGCMLGMVVGMILPFFFGEQQWLQRVVFWSPVSSLIGLWVLLRAGEANWFYWLLLVYAFMAVGMDVVIKIRSKFSPK